jgi:MoxR-like ATPase
MALDWDAGPRAGLFLEAAGQAFAAMDGRFSVAIDDVRRAAVPVLRHRIGTNFQAQAEGKNSEDIIAELLRAVGDPEPPKYGAKKRL